MRQSFSVSVASAAHITVGDLICYQVTQDTLISGRVTGVATRKCHLIPEQVSYMNRNNLTLPDDEQDRVVDDWSLLIFGEFVGSGKHGSAVGGGHAYVRTVTNVVFFPKD